MRELKKLNQMPYHTQLKITTIFFSSLFKIIISLISVLSINLNAFILNEISQFEELNKLLTTSIAIIVLQLLLFIFDYSYFIISKYIYHIYNNKYTNLSLKILFMGDSNRICSFNKSDIVFYSTDLSSDYISNKFNYWNSIISTIIGFSTYTLYFRKNLSYIIILFIAIVYMLVFFITTKLNQKISKDIGVSIDIQTRLNTLTSEFVDNSESIRLSGIQNAVYSKLVHLMESIKKNNKKIVRLNIVSNISKIIPNITINIILFLFIYSSIRMGDTIESYFLITPIVTSYIGFFESLLGLRSNYLVQREQEKRIMAFLSIQPEKTKTDEIHQELMSISANNITYTYTDNNNLLSYPNLKEHMPTIVLVQGPSGSGKTTFIRILSGLLTPLSGKVEISDVKNNKLTSIQCKKDIGYNPQVCYLYNSTIRENITLGEDYSDQAIIDALEKACALDFVRDRPNGLNTMLGPGGEGLSGGEKQRISLARTLIRKPKILFLDESFSSLDQKNGEKIFENLIKENIICFIISHRNDFVGNLKKIKRIDLAADSTGEQSENSYNV